MEYHVIKLLHILFACVSITGFITRGILSLRQSALLQQRWVRIVPHINDTLLLLSGITLVIQTGYNPLQHAWLAEKIALLFVYIGLGLMTLRYARSRRARRIYFVLAIFSFIGIVIIALSKSAA